jgi:hypothetical protein
MDHLLLFPRRKLVNCEHDLNVCKVCYAEHLVAHQGKGDRKSTAGLSCPECSRILKDDEMKALRVCFGDES